MLSYDSLLAFSKERGLPPAKLRGVARECAQMLTLKALYELQEAQALIFLGGTALRFGWGLPRFSEDLDFDTEAMSFTQWKSLLEEMGHLLSRRGLNAEIRAKERGSLLAGDVRFKNFLQAYRLAEAGNEKLKIKVEANRPKYPLGTEPRVISGYGEMIAVPFASTGLIIAEKILALLRREMGRDVYDLFFIAGKKWKPDARVFVAEGPSGDIAKAILERIHGLGPQRLVGMARRLEPFLFEPEQEKLVRQADVLLPSVLEYLSADKS